MRYLVVLRAIEAGAVMGQIPSPTHVVLDQLRVCGHVTCARFQVARNGQHLSGWGKVRKKNEIFNNFFSFPLFFMAFSFSYILLLAKKDPLGLTTSPAPPKVTSAPFAPKTHHLLRSR